MTKKRSIFSKIIEVLLVLLTFVTHWLIFYFVIITACKNTEEAARLNLSLPKEWKLFENLAFIFSYQHHALLKAFKNSVVITLVLAFIFLHEQVTYKSVIGCILIGAGTIFMVL